MAQECSSALLVQIKRRQRFAQPNEPEAVERYLEENVNIYCALSYQTTKTDSSVKALKAAVRKASDYNDVDVCMSPAVQ